MSPEAAQGLPVDHRSDIYSLGILFYDMLVGHVPFEAEAAADVMHQQIHSPPVPPRKARPDNEITDAAERLILKALSKKPDDRQQSMDELRLELQSCYGSVAYRRDAQRLGVDGGRLQQDLNQFMQVEEKRRSRDTIPEAPPPGEPAQSPGAQAGKKGPA
jgi:serine/threonine-protein kinase